MREQRVCTFGTLFSFDNIVSGKQPVRTMKIVRQVVFCKQGILEYGSESVA